MFMASFSLLMKSFIGLSCFNGPFVLSCILIELPIAAVPEFLAAVLWAQGC